MYRPNFCCECGKKVIRMHWHPWTSGQFCAECARRLRKERFTRPAILISLVFAVGLLSGRTMRPAPPPLILQRATSTPVQSRSPPIAGVSPDIVNTAEEEVYICGARTKKGTPCSRRVHSSDGPVRCWQHKGARAILAPDKLLIKD